MKADVVLLDLIQVEEGDPASLRVRLVARSYPSDANGFIFLTPECSTREHFEDAVGELKEKLDTLLQKAREAFRQHESKSEPAPRELHTVEEIWQAMEASTTLEGMQEIFNTLDLEKRREVANFVFSRLNIFKGVASTFSQHFNEEDCILE